MAEDWLSVSADWSARQQRSKGTAGRTGPKRQHTEHDEQAALVTRCRAQERRYPELAGLFAIPNGAHLERRQDEHGNWYCPQGQRLRAEGMKAGVPDLCLPVARGGYHGLYIEMKSKAGRLSAEQETWRERLEGQGYRWELCRTAEEGWRVIMEYLGQTTGRPKI